MNYLWLKESSTTGILTKNKLVVTNEVLFKTIMNELKLLEDNNLGRSRRQVYDLLKYYVYSEMRDTKYSGYDVNLLTLINPYVDTIGDPDRGIRKCSVDEIDNLKDIWYKLEYSSLEDDILYAIVSRMQPNLGYFALEVLNCVDVELINKYDIFELKNILEGGLVNNTNLNVNEMDKIVKKDEQAKTNYKVLSLAKRMNKTVFNGKRY